MTRTSSSTPVARPGPVGEKVTLTPSRGPWMSAVTRPDSHSEPGFPEQDTHSPSLHTYCVLSAAPTCVTVAALRPTCEG
jgi:hypothetical protein